jgi:hypothetical protein
MNNLQLEEDVLIDVTPEELQILQKHAENFYLTPGEKLGTKTVNIPYNVSLGAVNISGVLYLKNPIEDSWTNGVMTGVANGTFKLDKNNSSQNFYGPFTKINVNANFTEKEMIATLYLQDLLTGKWKKKGWTYLARW